MSNNGDNSSNPLVSISCATYNHEKYIRDTIEGFLMQKTTFPVEILIHDDASTDGTAKIIKEYEAKHPGLILPIYQTENQYSKGVMISPTFNWSRARGKYIAFCEGDDYWTDPLKLQKQVDFLEANPDYGMVSTDISLIDENVNPLPDNNMVLRQREHRKPTVDFIDLLNINLVNTLTVVARADLMKDLAERVVKENLWFVYDYWFWLNLAMNSKVRILPQKTAAYRVHSQGVSKQAGFFSKRQPFMYYDILNSYFAKKKVSTINRTQAFTILNMLFNLVINRRSNCKRRFWAFGQMMKFKHMPGFLANKILKKMGITKHCF